MKADNPRQNRIPFMMSDAELAAVDEWRFANKIATRAEAIRRLCQIGLFFDSWAERIDEAGRGIGAQMKDLADDISDLHTETEDAAVDSGYIDALIDIKAILDAQNSLLMMISPISAAAKNMREGSDMEQVLRAVDALKQYLDEQNKKTLDK